MKKSLIALMAVAVLLMALPVWVQAQEGEAEWQGSPCIGVWEFILGSEEKVVFNEEYQSGLVRRYYLDPKHEKGVGATWSVFYKDGSEHLFWKGWMLHTENAQVAQLLDDGYWHLTVPGKMPYSMGYLVSMLAFFREAKPSEFVDGEPMIEKMNFFVADKSGEPLMDQKKTIYLNKDSANAEDPIPEESPVE